MFLKKEKGDFSQHKNPLVMENDILALERNFQLKLDKPQAILKSTCWILRETYISNKPVSRCWEF